MLTSGLDKLSCESICRWASTCGILDWPEILRSRTIGEHAGLFQVGVLLETINLKVAHLGHFDDYAYLSRCSNVQIASPRTVMASAIVLRLFPERQPQPPRS